MDGAPPPPARTVATSRDHAWWWFGAWAAVGTAAALGAVSFALWIFLLPLAAAGALVLASRRASRGSIAGLLSGAGVALLVVAWVQRDGPGTTCWRTATGGGCTEHLDPRPWLVAGLGLVVAGVWITWRARRSAPHGAGRQAGRG